MRLSFLMKTALSNRGSFFMQTYFELPILSNLANFVDLVILVQGWLFYVVHYYKFCPRISRSYVATIIEMRSEDESEY
jgi:hypothetical protein